jgi:RHH-type proline utilization regulon transcriptional repressor/proline dehydrogenase/delta 1-pyrroline-5-carboxylate dehydrogenase
MRLVGQDNIRRYLPVRELRIRIDVADSPVEILLRVAAARSVGCRVTLSYERAIDPASAAARCLEWLDQATELWAAAIEFVEESNEELAKAIASGWARRIRYAGSGNVPDLIRKSANLHDSYVADAPVLTEGRVELLWYLEEQSISDNYHRYGNLGDRIDEERAAVK